MQVFGGEGLLLLVYMPVAIGMKRCNGYLPDTVSCCARARAAWLSNFQSLYCDYSGATVCWSHPILFPHLTLMACYAL